MGFGLELGLVEPVNHLWVRSGETCGTRNARGGDRDAIWAAFYELPALSNEWPGAAMAARHLFGHCVGEHRVERVLETRA